jgi:WD40 repeat protein
MHPLQPAFHTLLSHNRVNFQHNSIIRYEAEDEYSQQGRASWQRSTWLHFDRADRRNRFVTSTMTGLMVSALVIASFVPRIALFSWSAVAGNGHKPVLREGRVERLPAPILSLDFAQRSDLAVAALSDGRVRVWQLNTGEILHQFGFTEPETDQRQKDEGEVEPIRVRFSPDGKILAVSYLSRIHLYEVGTWSDLKTLGAEGEDIMRPLPPPHLSERTTGEKEPDDINTGTRKWAQRKMLGDGRTRITDFAFTPDGAEIVASYCRISCYDMPGSVRWMISGGNEPVRLWTLRTARMVWEHVSGPNRITHRVVLSPDGRLLVEVVFQPGHWGLHFRDLASGQESSLIALRPVPTEPPEVAFMPDNRRFVGLWDEPRKMWQMAMFDSGSGQVLAHFEDPAGAQHVALSPDGLWLAITTWRRPPAFKIWDVQKRKPLSTMKPDLAGVNLHSLDEIRFVGSRKIVVSDRSRGVVFTYELKD